MVEQITDRCFGHQNNYGWVAGLFGDVFFWRRYRSWGDVMKRKEHGEIKAVSKIVRAELNWAVAVAGTSTAIVIGLWFLFDFLVFLPRGVIQ